MTNWTTGGHDMFKIAICDDDRSYIETIKEIITQHEEMKEEVVFYEYLSGEELADYCWQQHELIFLDIQMPGMDGNETARLIRAGNKEAVLVFCTNYPNPTPESFKVQPFRYVIKDKQNKILKNDMADILVEMKRKVNLKYLNITGDGKVFRIPLKSILYISVIKRGTLIHLFQNDEISKIYCRESLKDLYPRLQMDGFEYAHNSYIVNMTNIIHMNKSVIVLIDKTELNISRSKKRQFDEEFSKFLHMRYKRV